MTIKIKDIPPEGLTLNVDQPLYLDDSVTSAACKAVLFMKPEAGRTIHITGHLQSTPELECSRCLERFPFKIDSDLDMELAPAEVLVKESEHELVHGELDTDFYRGEEINPVEIIREQLLISLPMVPLHSPDCKGLCSVCGADLNKTNCGHERNAPGDFGAFSALKDLFKK
jgi:uncharacterized protein